MILLLLECFVLCVIATIIITVSTSKNTMTGIHNAHPRIRERVIRLERYQKFSDSAQMSASKRIIKKLPILFLAMIVLFIMVVLAGANNFLAGTIYAFTIWVTIKLYVVFIIDFVWRAHSPKARIPGTEDMDNEYKDYKFYLSSIPRSLVVGLFASMIVGAAVLLLSQNVIRNSV